ncbi:MAG: F0F1 ATP synthase subunit gamma [Candidatus Sungbacteria bacterium]|nr:F0F1 ATP synthase subunit gamma [bacterium]MDZ4260516.1 F0F1 ATP synthase subunit gamma [Candidatus Sungbacteria bacterium]
MINEQTVKQEIEQLQSLIVLVETYETIAGTSVRRIRSSVLANRAFHIGLNRMFREITDAYKKEVEYLMKKKKITHADSLSLMKHTKKTALILFSANTGLYGDVTHRTFTAFLTEIKRAKADIIIIGRMGKMFFEEVMPGTAFIYFDFPDNAIDIEGLKKITIVLAEYEKVVAFYAVFKNLMTQQVKASIISGAELASQHAEDMPRQPYFFEPSLEEVTVFFETEIFASLLEQVFHESRLAKLASRMVLLDRAIINIESEFNRTRLSQQRMHHRTINRHLLDSLSGMSLWV